MLILSLLRFLFCYKNQSCAGTLFRKISYGFHICHFIGKQTTFFFFSFTYFASLSMLALVLDLVLKNYIVIFSTTKYQNVAIFFLRESFNLWRPLLIITFYHQTKTPINFWCRRGLNPRSLIQLSETLLIELTGTYKMWLY